MSLKCTFFILLINIILISVKAQENENVLNYIGNDSYSSKIYNGNFAKLNEFRYYVSIQSNGEHICGGSLIGKKSVLTAAHCVSNSKIAELVVHSGSIHRKQGGYYTPVRRIKLHENFMSGLQYDIAILELTMTPTSNWNVETIPLTDTDVSDYDRVTVLGFGEDETESLSIFLKWTQMQVLPKQSCKDIIGWGYNELICVQPYYSQGICGGDYGGPAIFNGKIIGVANFILNGCADSLPDEYASVYYHLSWIRQNM